MSYICRMSLWSAIGGFIGRVSGGGQPSQRQSVANAQVAGGSLRHVFDSSLPLHDLVRSTAAACLSARASERSVIRFIVSEFGKVDTEIALKLQAVLDLPNPVLSRVEFIENLSQAYDADGNIAIQLIRDDGGFPVEQWLMPSASFTPQFGAVDDPIPIGYRWSDGRSLVASNDLVMLRRGSVLSMPYKGRGVLEDCRYELTTLKAVQQAQCNFFTNGGAPNVAITFPVGSSVTQQQADDYRALWSSRVNPVTGLSNIAFVPDGGSVVNFGSQEMSFSDSKDRLSASIRETFQTPRILLGDTDNVNHNNGQTAIAIFERTVVLRFAQKLAAAYEKTFRANFHPFISVAVDPAIIAGFTTLSSDNGVKTQIAAQAQEIVDGTE